MSRLCYASTEYLTDISSTDATTLAYVLLASRGDTRRDMITQELFIVSVLSCLLTF